MKTTRYYEMERVFPSLRLEHPERVRLFDCDVREVQKELHDSTINRACIEMRKRIGGNGNLTSYLDCLEAARDRRGQYAERAA